MSDSFSKSWSGDFGDGLRGAIKTQLRKEGLEGERLISKIIAGKGISVDGDLKKSVTSSLRALQSGGLRVEIGPSVDYAPYVQFPTRPHWAPIGPLKDWARKKLGDEDAAYAVQWKIRNEGTDGQDFLSGPFRKLRKEVPGRLEDAMQDALNSDAD
jgi:hypothetical protein